MKVVSILCVVGLASSAMAQPLEFVIDPAQSSVELEITLDLGVLGGDTDSDSAALSGVVDAELDDPMAPTESWLHDVLALMDDDLNYHWDLGFLSTADATLVGGYVEYANPGVVIGPVPVVDGGYAFASVPTLVGGILTVSYDIFLFGSGTEIVDLSTFDPTNNDVTGTVVPGDGIVTMFTTIPFEGTEPLEIDGSVVGNAIYSGQATIVAVAQVPDCPADFTGDGVLDFFDVSAFLSAFAVQDPAADMTDDGVWDFFDVSAFLSAFGAGCP